MSYLTRPVSVSDGGTGSTSASGARTSLGVAASGSNSDITSILGTASAGLSSLILGSGGSLTLKQSTASYTVTWANPAAARAYTVPDNGTPAGTNKFIVADVGTPSTGDVVKWSGSQWVTGTVTASATAGGSTGSVQYNVSGAITGDSGLQYVPAGPVNHTLAPTWNTSATVFTGFLVNVADTSSASSSKLFDLQVGSSSKFTVDKAGNLTLGSAASLILPQATAAYTVTWTNPGAARAYVIPDNGVPTTQNQFVVADITSASSGQVIQYNGSRWVNGTVSNYAYQAVSGVTTLAATVSAAFVSGTTTVTLPLASAATQPVVVKNVGTGTVTVAIQGSDTIDGASSYTIGAKYASLTFAPAGTNTWYLI